MRPDKRKKNRGRYGEKSEGNSAQEKKAEEPDNNKSESVPNVQKENEKTDISKPVKAEETAEKVKPEVPPILNLRRETDDLKETKKFSKRQIFSNWDKYDEPIVAEEEDEIHDDFGSLIQRNFSGDEHFKFKFQQQWEKESCNINQDLFTLNLERLSSGLSCIPYYKRLNLPIELFSEDELQKMQDDAKAKVKDYESILKGEPPEPVTASLLGKLKDCIDEKVVKETVKNPYEDEEPTIEKTGEFTIEGYASTENVWGEPSQEEIHLDVNTETSAQAKDTKLPPSESKVEIKEEIKINQEAEVKPTEEKGDEFSFDLPERIEVEKEQRKKRPSNRRREAANRSSNKIEQPNSLTVNTAEAKSTINESVPSKEDILKEEAPEKIPEITHPQEVKNVPKKEPKVEPPVIEEKPSSSSLPRVKPVAPASAKKNKYEEDDELDSLLSLKEPSLPYHNLSQKAQDVEHEMESTTTKLSSIVIHEKKENLEEWLDSMLDD